MQRYTLLTIGKTHSGKSTFARELAAHVPNSVVVETDPIALFLKANVPTLHAFDHQHTGDFDDPSLKYLIFRTMLEFAINHEFNVILSNSNMFENGRKDVLSIIKRYPVKTIGVYFNYPEEILFERAKTSGRDAGVLRVSNDFNDLIIRQRTRMQPPNSKDFDHFFEITSTEELPNVMEKVVELFEKEV